MNFHPKARPRHLVIVLGDQLDKDSAGFDGFDAEQDAVWMAEVTEECTHVWSHKAPFALFLSSTGRYIQRKSNYCAGCRYDPEQQTGPSACPFTILYWDFLPRHKKRLARNQRMAMQLKNLGRLKQADRQAIREHAGQIRHQCLSRLAGPHGHN